MSNDAPGNVLEMTLSEAEMEDNRATTGETFTTDVSRRAL